MGSRRSIFLYPISLIYGAITAIRNFLYNAEILKSSEFSIPVISVGNITVGGTGKTPHTEYLIELLGKESQVAVLSRGYKRRTSGFNFAGPDSSASSIGDEPYQIFRKFPGITVAVDRDRVNGVRKILAEKPGTGVIILDDAFQHRRITPGFSILLSEYERLMVRDVMLPYGNLREGLSNMNRADVILITKSPENISPIQRRLIVKEIDKRPYQNLYFTTIKYKEPVPLFDTGSIDKLSFSSDEKAGKGAVVVSGIANPEPLLEYLKDKFTEIIDVRFGDHHAFNAKDILKIAESFSALKTERKYVITTEKDGVRFREFSNIAESLKSSFHYIPIGISFLNDDQNEFDNLIIDYVRKNKRNNRISQVKRLP
jgi:tetraacyldisaccharide 4'-kinase